MSAIMPRFGLAAGVVSLALAVVCAIPWWAPSTPDVVFLVPAFLGALVASVHGAWRLAATTICLCVAAVIPVMADASNPWDGILVLAPPAVTLGLGAWLIVNYWRARHADNAHRLPAWLASIRDRIGAIVGTVSLAVALVATFVSWPLLFPMMSAMGSQAGTVNLVAQGSVEASVYMVPLALLGALTALACGAWHLAALTAFFSVLTYLMFGPMIFVDSPSHYFCFVQQFFGPLVGATALTAYLIWSYRQSRRNVGGPLAGTIQCAVQRCTTLVGANPTRQMSFQPVAIGTAVEVTNRSKLLV